jgi:phosphohistidine phosphatase SixA
LPEPRPALEVFDEIGDKMRPKRVARYLNQLDRPVVALVGHQPTLGRFLAWLIGSKKAQFDLEKGSVAKVTCENYGKGGGALNWLITPDFFPPAEGVTR